MAASADDRGRDLTHDLRDPVAFRQHVSRHAPPISKDELIVEISRGRSVLDLGCIDHSVETVDQLGGRWLHAQIKEVAAELVGVDRLDDAARALRLRGFDIRVADVESFDLGRTFDIVVAGDLIEHLANLGTFLEHVARHMHAESRFVVSTPNPFNIEQFVRGLFQNKVAINDEHTVWLDPRVLHQLLARSPLEVVDFKWIDTRFRFPLERGRVLPRIVNPMAELVMRRRPVLRRDFAVICRLATDTVRRPE